MPELRNKGRIPTDYCCPKPSTAYASSSVRLPYLSNSWPSIRPVKKVLNIRVFGLRFPSLSSHCLVLLPKLGCGLWTWYRCLQLSRNVFLNRMDTSILFDWVELSCGSAHNPQGEAFGLRVVITIWEDLRQSSDILDIVLGIPDSCLIGAIFGPQSSVQIMVSAESSRERESAPEPSGFALKLD